MALSKAAAAEGFEIVLEGMAACRQRLEGAEWGEDTTDPRKAAVERCDTVDAVTRRLEALEELLLRTRENVT